MGVSVRRGFAVHTEAKISLELVQWNKRLDFTSVVQRPV